MSLYLFLLLISTVFNLALIIPFINFLYKMKLQRAAQVTKDIFNKKTPIFDKFHKHKAGTPVGGGVLIVFTTIIMFFMGITILYLLDRQIVSNYPSLFTEIKILLFTFISFSILGFYDDIKKMLGISQHTFYGLRFRHKIIIQIVLSLIISFWLFTELKVELINIPFFGVFNLGYFYIPFSAFVIISFANAVNISDGLDGLAAGVLAISLFAFWTISASILDTPVLIFIASWIGGILAFLYFNINPARLFLGDTGALSFGATFAVIGLLMGKIFVLPIIGGVFMLEITSSLLQLLSKKIYKKKLFPVSPIHLWLQLIGWSETKIVMRAWVVSMILAAVGLMIAFMR